ncbi:hypothetical protein K431DRAFT_235776 [Polychaeton citri CBS 116435]|uniref:Uncharacterized protein n=1 Tax=Polychaeton citri CBS 116435 TaxID=1314669 RepID=A0A9P4PWJ5_9PEZI|nr:hypothetical protein K431DRAFT_235776 [Polychaeton citri CBS 116435]
MSSSTTRQPGASVGVLSRYIPRWARLPVALATTVLFNTVSYSLTAGVVGEEFAVIKRPITAPWQVFALAAWKAAELIGCWSARLDYLDVACLSFLTTAPYFYLLYSFYSISASACSCALAIDVVALALPFALLRPLDKSHAYPTISTAIAKNDHEDDTKVPTPIDQDTNIRLNMTLLAASLWAVVLFASYSTWLPTYLVIYFDGIKDVTAAHSGNFLYLLALALPMGMAAVDYLYTPAAREARAPPPSAAEKAARFDPETASLAQTLSYNLGLGAEGFSKKATILTRRTAVVALSQFANSLVKTYGTVEGTELGGAVAWSSVWALGTVAVGLAFGWASDV